MTGPATLAALASMTVVAPELQRACAAIAVELGPASAVVEPGWEPLAQACGVRNVAVGSDRPFFVGSSGERVLEALASWQQTAGNSCDEFGVIVPASTGGRSASPADPTLKLWQAGYTPVTVHRVFVDTGVEPVEVVAAVVRPTPPRPVL